MELVHVHRRYLRASCSAHWSGALDAPDVAVDVAVAMHVDCVWFSIGWPPLGNILWPEASPSHACAARSVRLVRRVTRNTNTTTYIDFVQVLRDGFMAPDAKQGRIDSETVFGFGFNSKFSICYRVASKTKQRRKKIKIEIQIIIKRTKKQPIV